MFHILYGFINILYFNISFKIKQEQDSDPIFFTLHLFVIKNLVVLQWSMLLKSSCENQFFSVFKKKGIFIIGWIQNLSTCTLIS